MPETDRRPLQILCQRSNARC